MKIILRADVENLGRLGDVVTVKAGYGRNYLLPQGLAMLVTPGNIKAFELERKKLQARMDALRAAADELAGKLEGLVLPIVMRVGDNDKLYGSVTTAIIGDALAAQGIEVDPHRSSHPYPRRSSRPRAPACRRDRFPHREGRLRRQGAPRRRGSRRSSGRGPGGRSRGRSCRIVSPCRRPVSQRGGGNAAPPLLPFFP